MYVHPTRGPTALVYQQEVMCEFLSVEEHLLFQGTARMSDRYSPQEIAKRVDQVRFICHMSRRGRCIE